MSTSGIYEYTTTRDELIKATLRKLSVLAKGQTPDTEDIANAAMAMNLRIAEFKTKGMQLWLRTTYTFSPTLNVSSYSIGTGQTLDTPYPVKMLQAYRVDSGSTAKVPLELIADENFNRLPSSSGGNPVQLAYQPRVQSGTVRLWPTPDATAATSSITLVYTRPIQYFNASTDNPDLPEEWHNALIYNTAVDLAPEWGIPLPDRQLLMQEAKQHLDNAMESILEDASIYWQIDRR